MKKSITLLFLIFLSCFANAWEITEKNINEFIKFQNNYSQQYKNSDKKRNAELENKYFKYDSVIEQNDASALALYIRLSAEEKYINYVSGMLKNFKKTNAELSNPLIPMNNHYFDQWIEASVIATNDFYELAKKVEKREIKNGIKSNSDEIVDRFLARTHSISKEYKTAASDLARGITPRYGKSENQRELAKNDVVAQVLNYASGVPEDASGVSYFYPANNSNGQCIYKIAIDSSSPVGAMTNELMGGFTEASKFAAQITGQSDPAQVLADGVDLNKGDLKNISFYKLQGATQNKFTGATAYLRYQSRVDGLPDVFECDSNTCNIDRLKRGWALVASRCKGSKKAF